MMHIQIFTFFASICTSPHYVITRHRPFSQDRQLLSNYISFNPCVAPSLKQLFSAAKDDAIDLLSSLLRFNPNSRLTATSALSHPFFSNSPSPTPPSQLPRPKAAENVNHSNHDGNNKRAFHNVNDQAGDERSAKRRLNGEL